MASNGNGTLKTIGVTLFCGVVGTGVWKVWDMNAMVNQMVPQVERIPIIEAKANITAATVERIDSQVADLRDWARGVNPKIGMLLAHSPEVEVPEDTMRAE